MKKKITKKEVSTALIKGTLGAVPYFGPVIVEFFNLTVQTPLQERINAWIAEVHLEIVRLNKINDSFSIENLQKNEQFQSVFSTCVQKVYQNHKKERLELLKNVTLNSVEFNDKRDELQFFLSLMDQFSTTHVAILNTFNLNHTGIKFQEEVHDIKKYPIQINGISLNSDLKGTCLQDLESKNLLGKIYSNSVTDLITQEHQIVVRKFSLTITDLGKRFLKFIQSPGG